MIVNLGWRELFSTENKIKYGEPLYATIALALFYAIEEDDDECVLIQASSGVYTCTVYRDEYIDILEQCLEYYISIEDYNVCVEIRDTILELDI